MVTVNIGMLHYILDHVYGAFVHRTKISPPFFSRGWGGTKLELLERLISQLFPEVEGQNWPPSLIQPIWRTVWETQNACLREGVFRTPCDEQLLSALPPESHNARVAFLVPKDVPPQKMACVVHLAGTGDHTFERRLRLGGPLLKQNIATMVLESPFYGQRRPMLQRGAKLLCVSDLLLLGRATIEEARSLLYWLDSEAGFGKMGVCGLSMGGVHAAMVGSLHPTPVATLPFLSPHSAVVAFCEGILKHATAWEPPPQPQPELERSQSVSLAESMPSIGKYIKDRSTTLSAAIIKRLSSLTEDGEDFVVKNDSLNLEVTEIKIPGVKVIVKLKSEDERFDLKGRITFFSRSNCRDCTAVRKFFREKGLPYVEINIDVFPKRAKELVERTGKSEVPQIFFNEKLLGGLVTLNSLRNSGELDKRMRELLSQKCPDGAPKVPVYGFDDDEDEEEEEEKDELLGIVKLLRQSLPIQDRLIKMKIVKNCFAGDDMLEVIIHHLDCGRKKGIETGRQLVQKHFIKHVFGENDFEEGRHFYRFLEHEPFITACFNFRISINDSEPKSPSFLADKLARLMTAILEAYASDDRHHVDYYRIRKSEEFRRYLNLTRDLQRVDLRLLSPDERLAFFLNLYNAMAIHAVITIGHPEGILDRRAFFGDFQYVIGGYPYSLSVIQNGILRNNRKSPYSLVRPFGNGDRRLKFAPAKVNPLIHFGLCNGTRSSPTVRFFTAQGVEGELRGAAREYFQNGAIEINLDKRTVSLTRIIKWFSADFGQEKDVLRWVMNYLDTTRAGLLTHLLSDGGPIHFVYQDYDWAGNL